MSKSKIGRLSAAGLLACALAGGGLAACGAVASGDDPPKSRARIVADACHYAYHTLQTAEPADGYTEIDQLGAVGDYAYLVAFTADFCEPKGGR